VILLKIFPRVSGLDKTHEPSPLPTGGRNVSSFSLASTEGGENNHFNHSEKKYMMIARTLKIMHARLALGARISKKENDITVRVKRRHGTATPVRIVSPSESRHRQKKMENGIPFIIIIKVRRYQHTKKKAGHEMTR
jgi:hypothetical protein